MKALDSLTLLEAARRADPTPSVRSRKVLLRAMLKGLRDHEQRLIDALAADLDKPELESRTMELYPVRKELQTALRNISDWASPKRVSTPLALFGTRAEVVPSPKGVVLVLAPWNFPMLLTINPVLAAIAAGNRVVVKPSEHTPATAKAMTNWLEECLPSTWVQVVNGGAELAQELTALPFNHIYFTGGPSIGKHIIRAAAEHLTPLTLELGGKSPAVVDTSARIKDAAMRVAWGKWINAGQVCISPDYILVHKHVERPLIEALQSQVRRSFAGYALQSKDYACIVNRGHFDRLKGLLDDALEKGAKLEFGGGVDEQQCRMEPTVLSNVTSEMRILKEEVFGPILPVVCWEELQELPAVISQNDHPLALYIFSRKRKHVKYILDHTRSGTVAVNETIFQNGDTGLPFGGVQGSGWGRANGKAAFDEFCNARSVLHQTTRFNGIYLLTPPYTGLRLKAARFMSRYL
ncbi:MAG: aldehyde dehydrogenase family protein [Flavobacteriales bacterium]|nr:aldehyde dehydrogenase family protein [Flavobacteriales bacterium]